MSKLSFIIPAYNEVEGIDYFHNELLLPSIKSLKQKYEIIYVNDGSTDKTLEILADIAKDPAVKVIDLSRNFGKEIAITAGIFNATGEALIILDADGQHPPNMIGEFIKQWKDGSQVVVGIRNKQNHEGFIKEVGSKIFYKTFNSASGAKLTPRSTDFRLIDKYVQQEFIKMHEHNRITRGLIDWLGFKRSYVYFDSPERQAGQASYGTTALFKLAMNSFISLSLKPLFFFGWIGLAITVLSSLLGIFIIIEQLILKDPLGLNFTGSAMLGIFIAFLIGLTLISQAMMSIYISHIHKQAQQRPLFVINKKSSINLHG